MHRATRQFIHFFRDKTVRRNVRALFKYFLFLTVVIFVSTVFFQVIMRLVEGQSHSWVTGLYWTLITMSTLGYGDVTFTTDLGRLYTLLILSIGIVLLLVVLPFAFIRFLYAPWVDAQLRMRTPREIPLGSEGHVILCLYDDIAPGFIRRLEQEGIPFNIIESDLDEAAHLYHTGLPVVAGDVDDRATYEALRVQQARMVFANHSDAVNTNIVLTVREVAPDVPVVALANHESAAAVLELSGAAHVLPLKRWLGEQLANRINATQVQSHLIGRYKDLLIAELPVRQTPLADMTIRETHLRENIGVNIIGVWERGQLFPARPETHLSSSSVLVVMGTAAQLEELNFLFAIYDINPNPVIVIGGGDVGDAAARSLQRKEVPVHVIERDRVLSRRLRGIYDKVIHGDAADPHVLMEAGVDEAPSVLITTKEDATNIFLVAHCRRLNPQLRIVSRITHERNIEAIHRAGVDFVLGSASLGVEATFSILKGKELIVLGYVRKLD